MNERLWSWDSEQPVYAHGLPFSEVVAENIDAQKKRVSNNFASMVIIDGGVGQGKTTLGVLVAEYYQGKPLVFSEQIATGGQDFISKLNVCIEKGHRVLLYDESGDFSRRGTLQKLNALLNRVFETYRAFQIMVILLLPSMRSIDGAIFEKQIPRLLLNCHDREPGKDGSIRGYGLTEMFYLQDKMRKEIVKPLVYSKVAPNFRAHFLDLSPKRGHELSVFSMAGKSEIYAQAKIKNEGLVGVADLCELTGKSDRWVRGALSAIGAKPVYSHKRFNYYGADVARKVSARVKRG